MVLTMAPGHIMAEVRWWSPSEIDLIIEVRGIGTATHIMFGGRDTGVGGITNRSGYVATTSYVDTDARSLAGIELLNRLNQAPARQAKTNGCRETT